MSFIQPQCHDCQIFIRFGSTNSSKCSVMGGYWGNAWYGGNLRCCNCAKEHGWSRYEDRGCRFCKARELAAEKAAAERAVAAEKAADKVCGQNPA